MSFGFTICKKNQHCRLVQYKLRCIVAICIFLAWTLIRNFSKEVPRTALNYGSRADSYSRPRFHRGVAGNSFESACKIRSVAKFCESLRTRYVIIIVGVHLRAKIDRQMTLLGNDQRFSSPFSAAHLWHHPSSCLGPICKSRAGCTSSQHFSAVGWCWRQACISGPHTLRRTLYPSHRASCATCCNVQNSKHPITSPSPRLRWALGTIRIACQSLGHEVACGCPGGSKDRVPSIGAVSKRGLRPADDVHVGWWAPGGGNIRIGREGVFRWDIRGILFSEDRVPFIGDSPVCPHLRITYRTIGPMKFWKINRKRKEKKKSLCQFSTQQLRKNFI